jgi:GNAT superfamily N-acetyltransferase
MGWSIAAASFNEQIHSLIYRILAEVDGLKGQDAASYTGRYLYHHLRASSGFCAYAEGSEEPCGIIIFSPHELRFLFVDECETPGEIAASLLEHALSSMQAELKSTFIFSTFPSWKGHLGQDLLTPLLRGKGFTELHLLRLSVPVDSEVLAGHLSGSALEKLNEQGYSIDGWRSRDHLNASMELIIKNPNALAGSLVTEASAEAIDWLNDHIFIDECGREAEYPPECSSTVWHKDRLAGVLLCSEKGWIHQIAVEYAYQRKGVAQAMMTRTYRALKVLRTPAMALSVYQESPVALEWYGKLGFSPTLEHSVWCWKK